MQVLHQCYTKLENKQIKEELKKLKKTIKYGLKFIDNCRFMQASLLDLTDNLSDKFYIQNVLNVEIDVKNVKVLIKKCKNKEYKIERNVFRNCKSRECEDIYKIF